MSADKNKDLWRAYLIYDTYKGTLLNTKYYGSRLSTFRRYNFWLEMLIAVGATGSGLAGFAVWQMQYGQSAWAALSMASVILALAKPLLRLDKQIEIYAKLYGEYVSAYAKIKDIVDEMQVEREISPALLRSFKELRTRSVEMARLRDPALVHPLLLQCQAEVNLEINIDRLWLPSNDEQPVLQELNRTTNSDTAEDI